MFSKTRLAPIKGMTIPCLELMAVLIGVRCVKFVQSQLKCDIEEIYVWTDAQCVIKWISSNKKLSVFVSNRVREIRGHPEINIKYVSTTDNPSDVATRGNSLRQHMEDSLWWNGPLWLHQKEHLWPNTENSSETYISEYESEISANMCIHEMLLETRV